MRQYLTLLSDIIIDGIDVATGATLQSLGRKPTALSLHPASIQFDLRDGFPAVTTKPLWWKGVVAEWIWFMRGSGNIQYLRDQKTSSIWESWVKKDEQGSECGDLGCVYGVQFRHYQGVAWPDRPGESPRIVEVDQIANAVADIRAVKANPADRSRRRIIVTLWNPPQIEAMALPPCHTFHMYNMEPDGNGGWNLNLQLFARSIDAFLGLPFNIASYALMLHMMAGVTGCIPAKLTIAFNDVHIYDNQLPAVRDQLKRKPRDLPKLVLPDNLFTEICPDLSIDDAHKLEPSMFRLEGYDPHPALDKVEVAV